MEGKVYREEGRKGSRRTLVKGLLDERNITETQTKSPSGVTVYQGGDKRVSLVV